MKKMMMVALVAAGLALPMMSFAAEADMSGPSIASDDGVGFSTPDSDTITLADASDSMGGAPATDSSEIAVGQQD